MMISIRVQLCHVMVWSLAWNFEKSEVSAAAKSVRTISIATPGDISPTSTASLPFIAPAMDTAIDELRVKHAGTFEWQHTYIYDKNITYWAELPYNVADMVSKWYYQRRTDADLTAFIFTGTTQS